jgi:SAM-dependent methyltransferase
VEKSSIGCNICGASEHKLIKKGVYGNEAQNVYRCCNCDHVFLAPLLSDEDEMRFYSKDYPAFLLLRGDKKSVTPHTHFTQNQEQAPERFRDIKHLLSREKNVLEIGSATGFFLSYIKEFIEEVCGVEPNSAYREYANGIEISTFESLGDIKGRKFDIIFLYYVLEHIKEPVVFLENIQDFLKNKNSMIVIEVPNVNEALVSMYKSLAYNKFVWQKAHCNYFSVKVLEELFSKVDLSAEFFPVQRYDFPNHLYWLVEGKPGGMGKYSGIFSEKLDLEYRGCLKKAWLCDSILAIVKQKEQAS